MCLDHGRAGFSALNISFFLYSSKGGVIERLTNCSVAYPTIARIWVWLWMHFSRILTTALILITSSDGFRIRHPGKDANVGVRCECIT